MKQPIRHAVITASGLLWGGIALAIHACFGLTRGELLEMTPRFIGVAIVTSYAVTRLFRGPLSAPDVKKLYWLPFATIASGVSLWTILIFCYAAIISLVRGRHDLFDGFPLCLVVALVITLTVALPVTYPAAYLTQRLIARFGTKS